ncbi:MAG: Hg(II) uptake system permease component MerT family [Gammaproteobacteria bacterium]|nr:MAG: Hg(II) uptake system permease component MerT family [Gammaproteobacteria bacterium]
MSETSSSGQKGSMFAAGLAAIGASLCCVAPLVLLSLGIGGAWISTLTALTPYRWIFISITAGFLGWAFYKLYIAPRQCVSGDACALPGVLRNQRIIFWVVTVALITLITFPYYGLIFFE